jgi:triosephosphate isomerase
MNKRKMLVAGNWKMNGSLELVKEIGNAVKEQASSEVEVVVFPPAPLISATIEQGLVTGSQTVSEYEAGAYTGELEANLVASLGAKYTLVGHSERRSIYGESSQDVANKFAQAQAAKLIPILCVGETLAEREQNLTEQVVAEQIDAIITKLGVEVLNNSVIAYEPVWAIGTGKTASPEQAQQVHKFIRDKIAGLNEQVAQQLPLLYGGSVNETNSKQLFAQNDIDGGLIGGASLKADAFVAIIESAKGLS